MLVGMLCCYYLNTIAEDVQDDSSEDGDDEDDDNAKELVSEIEKSASKETTPDKDAQDSEANGLTPNKKRNIRGSTRSDKKKQRLSKQEEFKKCMEEFTKSQKESDEKFLEEMKHQINVDAELRKQELKAYTDSMALLANAISSRQQPTVQQPLSNPCYFEDENIGKTYYKL